MYQAAGNEAAPAQHLLGRLFEGGGEPLLGSALGYAVGLADAPGWRTGVGGIVIVASVVTVIVAKGRN